VRLSRHLRNGDVTRFGLNEPPGQLRSKPRNLPKTTGKPSTRREITKTLRNSSRKMS